LEVARKFLALAAFLFTMSPYARRAHNVQGRRRIYIDELHGGLFFCAGFNHVGVHTTSGPRRRSAARSSDGDH
jgi:hypothetical protein